MFPKIIQKLISIFSRFPGVGQRSATRFVFYLIKLPKKEIEEISDSILQLKKIKFCHFCFNPIFPEEYTENEILCSICKDKTRNRKLLLIVEKEVDLEAIENTKKYSGIYFILGGTVERLKKEEIKNLRIEQLKERIKNPEKFGIKTRFEEIIIGTNPTTEGEATAIYLKNQLKDFKIKISKLARGLPSGGELEYADEETISSALEGRK